MFNCLLAFDPPDSRATQTAPGLSHPRALQVGLVPLTAFQSIGTEGFENVVYDVPDGREIDI
jgi:hypothetical protein